MAEEADSVPGLSDHCPGFWSVLQHLQHTSQLCDVQLCVSHTDDPLTSDAIPAHKVVLVACSSFFRAALETSELLDVYNFVGVSRENLQVVVDYMYRRLTLQELMSNSEAAFAAQSIQVITHTEGGSPVPESGDVGVTDAASTHSSLAQRPGSETGDVGEQYLDSAQTDLSQNTESSMMMEVEQSEAEVGKDKDLDLVDHESAKQKHLDTTETTAANKTKQCAGPQTNLVSKESLPKKVPRIQKDTCRRAPKTRVVVKSEHSPSALSNQPVEIKRIPLGRSSQRRRKDMNYKLLAEGIDPTDEDQAEESVDMPSDLSEGHLEHCNNNFNDPDFSVNIGQPKKKRGRPPKAAGVQQVVVLSETEEGGGYTIITRDVGTSNPGNAGGEGENNTAGEGECDKATTDENNPDEGELHNNPDEGELNNNPDEGEQIDPLPVDSAVTSEDTNTENMVVEGPRRWHVRGRTVVGSLQCTNCNRAFNSESALTQHSKLVHGVQILYGCTACGQELASLRLLEKHKKDEHQMALYACSTCGTSFKTRDGLKLHQQKKHSGEKPTFACTVCLKAFYLKGELKNHLQYHSTERSHQCDQCTRAFKSKSLLVRHVNTFHSSERKFQCDVCGAMFKTRNDCKAHRLKHFRKKNPLSEDRKPGKRLPERQQYPCTQCGKVFKKRAHQLVHENLQHRQKNDGTAYLCTVCNKVFSIRHYLMQHIKNCHTDRRFTCSQCSQTFSQRGDLKKHETIAGRCKGSVAEPKPFSCPYCSRGFSLKGNLSKHLQHPERCRQHPSNPSNPELIVLLQQEGEAAAHGETPGEQAEGQVLDTASLQGEEGAVPAAPGVYSLGQDGNLELQGLVDGNAVPISMSAVNGQYQFHLQDGQLTDGQVVTYQVAADGDGQGEQAPDGQVITYQVASEGDGQEGHIQEVVQGTDGQVVTYQIPAQDDAQTGSLQVQHGQVTYQIPGRNDNQVHEVTVPADLADNTQVIHLFDNGNMTHSHPADTQVMEVVEGHPEVIISQGHTELTQGQGHSEVTQGQGHSEVIQSQCQLQIIQGRVIQTPNHPEIIQGQGHPEVIQNQGHPEIFQGQGNPEAIQVNGDPDDLEEQGHLQIIQGVAIQTPDHADVLQGHLEVIPGHEVREEVVTEMGMDTQTIEDLTEVTQEVVEVSEAVAGGDGSVRQEVVLGADLTEGIQEVVQVIHDMTHANSQEVVTDDITHLTQGVVYMEQQEDIATEQLI